MKTLIKLATLAGFVFVIASCSMLKEAHNAATNASVPLYAYFESAIPDSLGCYPEDTTDNNNNSVESSSLRAMYEFYIETQYVVTVCVTVPDIDTTLLVGKTVRFMATDTVVDSGQLVGTSAYTIPNATSSPLYILGAVAGTACQRSNDPNSKYLGQLNMQDFTKFKYIIAVAESCGTCAGTALSPYTASQAVYGSY
ncbi:MAG: hypothetical protein V1647_07265 [Pseudomonadota bacterium]